VHASSLSPTRIPAPVYDFFAHSPGAAELTRRLRRDYRLSKPDAEDLLADALIIALEDFASLSDQSHLEEWIWAIVLDQIRRRQRILRARSEVALEDRISLNIRDLRGDPEDHSQALQLLDGVRVALDQLTPIRGRALRLFLLEQLTISEIAGILGITQHTAKKHLSEAVVQLRHHLKGAGLASDEK
jgi:RNA polymerase sigma factor (sigma-70 family)